MEILQILTYLMVLVVSLSGLNSQSNGGICSNNTENCLVSYVSQSHIDIMRCSGYGQVDRLPQICTNLLPMTTLIVEKSSVINIQAMAFAGIVLNELTLSNLNIETLDELAFEGLGPHLTSLKLDNNHISELPTRLFQSLAKLQFLNLRLNRLKELNDFLLEPLSGLTLLNLADNELVGLHPASLRGVRSLLQLHLQNNRLSSLDDQLFQGLDLLEELHLERNRLEVVTSMTFNGLVRLRDVYLSDNYLKELPTGLFKANPMVEHIDLSRNQITLIQRDAIVDLTSLKTLLLNDNILTALRPIEFRGLSSLSLLNISNNKIADIESNSLNGMPYLVELDFSRNSVRKLPQGLFDPLGALLRLDFSYNLIDMIEYDPFSAQRRLVELDLSHNHISIMTEDFFLNTASLKQLNLSHNAIAYINESTFDNCKSLTSLDLSNNLLDGLVLSNLFHKRSAIQWLSLSNNPLSHIRDYTFAQLTEMTQLFLDDCCLDMISFHSPLRLEHLALRYNFIEKLQSNAFAGLTQLKHLDLGRNDIEIIESGAFFALRQIELVNLTGNELTIEQLSSNRDDILPENRKFTATIDLSWNKISGIAEMQQFGTLLLAGNPLECNCELPIWFEREPFADFENIGCELQNSNSRLSLECYQLETCSKMNQSLLNSVLPAFENFTESCLRSWHEDIPTIIYSKEQLNSRREECYGLPTKRPKDYPQFSSLSLNAKNWTIYVSWNITNSGASVVGYVVRFSRELPIERPQIDDSVFYLPPEDSSLTSDMITGGQFLICVSANLTNSNGTAVISSCQRIQLFPYSCDETTMDYWQCSDYEPFKSDDITKWLIIGIATGVGLLLISLFALLFIVLCCGKRKKKVQEESKKSNIVKGEDITYSRTTGKPYLDTMAEQSIVYVNDTLK